MKAITLIHTVRAVADTFGPLLRNAICEEIKIHNIFDDFFADDPAEKGVFTRENLNRLCFTLKSAELTGADLIVVTCSTLTPAVAALRQLLRVPVLAIDDAMTRRAVRNGGRILLLATAQSTIEPTLEKLAADAARAGTQPDIRHYVVPGAITALKAGDLPTHDRLVLDYAASIDDCDVVVLAQASMAHLETQVADVSRCRCEVLSSPRLCIREAAQICGLPYREG